ncbi:isochorismatase family protein, partial [Herbaspirillum sp. HC18]
MIVNTSDAREQRFVTLPARPEPLRLAVDETAVVVVDMQNAYASPNGYLDLAGFDISGAKAAITAIQDVVAVARGAGVPVIF